MSLANLQKKSSIKDGGDSVGGAVVLASDIYPMTIDVAFFGESSGGAASLNIHMKNKDGAELRSTIYLTSGRAKGQKNVYIDRDGEEQYLPGFNLGTSLTEIVLDKPIGDVDTEEKIIKLYNVDQKAEIDTKVDMLVELLGKQLIVGVLHTKENKRVKDDAGNYVPTSDIREANEVDKFFNTDGFTNTELAAKANDPGFIHTWKKKWKGVVRDRTVDANGDAPKAGAPKSAPATTSLFTDS